MGGWWTAAKLAKRDLLPEEFKTKCPFCGEIGKEETIEHVLIQCRKWAEVRARCLGPLMDVVVDDRLPIGGRATLLLGGEFRGRRLDSWLPTKAIQPIESEDAEHGNQVMCVAYRLASSSHKGTDSFYS